MADRSLAYMPIDDIRGAPVNPKGHDLPLIERSMDRFGYTAPIEIDERTGLLVSGHGRVETLQARKQAGQPPPDGVRVDGDQWLVPVVRGWASKNDDEAAAYLVTANRTPEAGGWIDDLLAATLQTIAETPLGLEGVGYTTDDLAELLVHVQAHDRSPAGDQDDPDGVPSPPSNPVTTRGDVWLLGPHRVMCGDSRDPGDVTKLLNGGTINLAFTSPPYADRRKYDETSGFQPIPPDEYVAWFAPVAANVAAHLASDGSWFVNIKAGADGLDTDLYVLDLVIAHVREWGWHYATEFCWERSGVPKQVTQRFKNQFESIYQFARDRWKMRPDSVRHWSEHVPTPGGPGVGDTSWANAQGGNAAMFGASRRGMQRGPIANFQGGGDSPYGSANESAGMAYPGNRLPTFSGTHEATGHTAAFPVGLPTFFVKAYTDPGDVVYDPFCGSGSTIVAASQEGRAGCGMEISPAYCDMTMARWQRLTGENPVRESTGEPHDFLAAAPAA